MSDPAFVPLADYRELPAAVMRERAAEFLAEMGRRRSVRQFSDRQVPREVVEDCVAAAATAPSGANLQPWHFVIVQSAAVKRRIREAAEREERDFYERRAPRQWLEDLAPLGTGPNKPFLEAAPCLVVPFVQLSGRTPEGAVRRHYYAVQSAGIAVGLLIAAIHHAGLVCLPYTPSRMGFLNEILGRPAGERPMLILVTGYPAPDAVVPDVRRKPKEAVLSVV
jgi:nitroreductase